MIQLHFSYCSAVWKNCGQALSAWDKLQKRRRSVLPHCCFFQLWCWCLVLITTIALERSDCSASNLRTINDGLQIKPINNLVPHYLSSMFTERNGLGYAIGTSNKFEVPLPRTSNLQKGLSYTNLTLWNRLPCDLGRERSFNRCKQFSAG